MVDLHTIVIGTSKSKNAAVYYLDSKAKFWGLLHKSGVTPHLLEPTDFNQLIENYGIGFGELAFDHVFLGDDLENESIKNDKAINEQIDSLNIGIPKLMKHLLSIKPKRMVFNGKATASSFYQFVNNNRIEKISTSFANEQGFAYGKIGDWNGIEVWMMPNTSNAAGKSWKDEKGEETWLNFWGIISNDIPKKNNLMKIGLSIGLLLLAIATYFLLKK
jgi:G:T/U-mismatch repair DNA glycosylase